ncbi:MAG: carboxylase [Candidatus Marinimicrobia bacterium]|nr:carboxylase [Candidatus Neomarinimicrobiota bacterium]
MKKQLKIRDLTLRDGQQSQFATRMKQEHIDRVLPYYQEANFYAMEVWGGAVPDSVMRYLDEDPWYRLESIVSKIGDKTKLTALSRGRNLFGYNPYPDSVIEGFCKNALESGLHIMRIFDALNDFDNIQSTVDIVNKYNGIVDCGICYTVDPKFTLSDRLKSFFNHKKLPKNIFNVDYFIEKAKDLEKMGAKIITLKDMAGLMHPAFADALFSRLMKEISVPIDMHTHSTPGYGLATYLVSMLHGLDIIDTVILSFAGGTAAPAFELVQLFADKLDIDTGVNLEAVAKINKELIAIQPELAEFDGRSQIPIDFDIAHDSIPDNVNVLFDQAIDFAKKKEWNKLLKATHKIENYFNFPPPNDAVREAEIPGGMYSNLVAQLESLKLGDKIDKVLKYVPKVRVDSGCPPLVTPSSQIVGGQAVNCVVDESKGLNPFYTTLSKQFINLVKGQYGKTPTPIDSDFRAKITGDPKEMPYDTSNYEKQKNPKLKEYNNVRLAINEKEELLLELFPSVADKFLQNRRRQEFEINKIAELKADQENDYLINQGAIE